MKMMIITGYLFVNKTKKGQSYLYDHRKWNDLNPDHATMRLKAYTVMQPVNKIHLRYCKADSKIRIQRESYYITKESI